MLRDFLNLWPAIEQVIRLSKSKSFLKNKELFLLKDLDLIYLRKCLSILEVFVRASTKLQAEKYPTIYYSIPEIYNIYFKLEQIKETLSEVFNI